MADFLVVFLKVSFLTSRASIPRISSIVSFKVMLFLLTSERYDLSLSGNIVLRLSMSFCSSSSKVCWPVKMLTAADCNSVPLLLREPLLMLLEETQAVEVDG